MGNQFNLAFEIVALCMKRCGSLSEQNSHNFNAPCVSRYELILEKCTNLATTLYPSFIAAAKVGAEAAEEADGGDDADADE